MHTMRMSMIALIFLIMMGKESASERKAIGKEPASERKVMGKEPA